MGKKKKKKKAVQLQEDYSVVPVLPLKMTVTTMMNQVKRIVEFFDVSSLYLLKRNATLMPWFEVYHLPVLFIHVYSMQPFVRSSNFFFLNPFFFDVFTTKFKRRFLSLLCRV